MRINFAAMVCVIGCVVASGCRPAAEAAPVKVAFVEPVKLTPPAIIPQLPKEDVAPDAIPAESIPAEPAQDEPAVAESAPVETADANLLAQAAKPVIVPVNRPADASDEFFGKGMIPELRIRLIPKEEQQLRADQRRYVDCILTENGTTTYKKVKMKLKGAAGSFRNLDDRPAITLSMAKKGERFHGMDKFHLNNSVQDESYLNELISSQLCLEAGLPAARVTHARVWLNDRDLGFYVLKEGLDDIFLARHFENPKGNLYDGGFCQDIDAALEKDEGDGPDDMSDLKELIAACREGDQAKRWALVEQKVDIDAFLNFVALELMMSHWDGYCQNRNNYRVYFRADNKKVCFFPHGMDQMFNDPNFGVFNVPGPIVANAVLSNPAWQAKYRQRVRELLPNFEPDKLHAKVDVAHARIRPVLAKMDENRARNFDDRARDYKNRVNDRAKNIRNQFPPEPIPLNSEGWALIEHWEPKPVGDTKLEKKTVDGKDVLSIETGPSNNSTSSFRTKLRLGKGTYRLEAKVKTINVTPLTDASGAGAGIRLSGAKRDNQASGTADWQTVSHTVDVAEDLREVEVVVELRSTSGTALFDTAGLRAVKVK